MLWAAAAVIQLKPRRRGEKSIAAVGLVGRF